jgi:two-component system response regulator RpaA
LDVMMPEVDGFAVCDLVRRNDLTAKIPIVMLTAMTGQLPRLSALDAGVNEYLTKPFSPKEVVRRVEQLLAVAASES